MIKKLVILATALVVFAMFLLAGTLQFIALFQEPAARAVALGYFGCALTTLILWLNRGRLKRWGKPSARRFILLGSLGAAWVEFIFWAAEKITGAVGVAASSNLFLDLVATMPWYVGMVALLWWSYKRFGYGWKTIALLGGFYEIGADGLLGPLLSGTPISPGYLALLLVVYFWVFVVVYSPIVLLPVWAIPMPSTNKLFFQKALGALLPLLALAPYFLLFFLITA